MSELPPKVPSLEDSIALLQETSKLLTPEDSAKNGVVACPECGAASRYEYNRKTHERIAMRCEPCATAVRTILLEAFGPPKLLMAYDELRQLHEQEDDTEWIWGQLAAPGYLTRVDGRPKVAGKSTLLFALCAAIRGGQDFLGFPTRQVPVAYCSEQRWKALNAKLIEPYGAPEYMHLFHDEPMNLESLCERLHDEIDELGVELVILDTASKWMKLVAGGRNDSDIMSQQMDHLENLAQNVAVIVADYTKKGETSVGEGTLGATEQVGRADILMELKKPDSRHENVRRLEIVGRSDAPEMIEYEMNEDGRLAPCELEELRAGDKRERVLEALKEIESEGGQAPTGSMITEAAAMRREDVFAALNELRAEGKVGTMGSGKAQFWYSDGNEWNRRNYGTQS